MSKNYYNIPAGVNAFKPIGKIESICSIDSHYTLPAGMTFKPTGEVEHLSTAALAELLHTN